MTEPRIIVASNRGPVSFVKDEAGAVVPKRGTGGLVTALTGALEVSGGLWVASAMTEEDRRQAAGGQLQVPDGGSSYDVRYLAFDPDTYDGFYNGISNRVLWFLHHILWDIPRVPAFDGATERNWDAFVRINRSFAETLADAGAGSGEAAYLVQDYHLSLVPAMLRELEPGAGIVHFSHIPFADAGYLRVLPEPIRRELLEGLLGADLLGFQAEAWAKNFLQACRAHTGAEVDADRRTIAWQGREVRIGVYPISIDVESLRRAAGAEEVVRARRSLGRRLGDRRILLRVDRADPSKNILRGFQAYEAFLSQHKEWRGNVVFLAHLNPSRTDLPEYRAYAKDCQALARRINARLGRRGWQPVRLSVADDLHLALAAYTLYDVLMVNPVFDGMNLVAKEGPVLNERDGVLILSENAGAAEELGQHAIIVNPFDVGRTASAIAAALDMEESERSRRAAGLREKVAANRLDRWVQAQLDDLQKIRAGSASPAGRSGAPRSDPQIPTARPGSPPT